MRTRALAGQAWAYSAQPPAAMEARMGDSVRLSSRGGRNQSVAFHLN